MPKRLPKLETFPEPQAQIDDSKSGFRGNIATADDGKKHVIADIFRPASKNESILLGSSTEVKCTLETDTDDPHRRVYIRVWVKSRIRPGLWTSIGINADEENLLYLVQAAGNVLAEQQCEMYKDMHNPESVGKIAVECLRDIQEAAEKARRHRGKGH